MEVYEEVKVWLIFLLSVLHAPAALSPRKGLPAPVEQKAVLVSEAIRKLWRREIPVPAGNDLSFILKEKRSFAKTPVTELFLLRNLRDNNENNSLKLS